MFHEMKPIIRRGLGLLLIAACVAVWIVSSGMSAQALRQRTCQGKARLDVTITDSLERQFVGKSDVASWLEKEYRAYAGLPLDSVDLDRIEKLVCAHSVVRDCQAWLTDDGVLHLSLSQREPVVRFDDGTNGYYADATGFVFPLQSRGTVNVPVVDGRIPMKIPRGFKGTPEKEAEKAWLERVIALVNYMDGTVWENNIVQMTVNGNGDFVLTPRRGEERFIFGEPVRVKEKFGLMKAYYESVVPVQPEYRSVDLRFRGQLVCRK